MYDRAARRSGSFGLSAAYRPRACFVRLSGSYKATSARAIFFLRPHSAAGFQAADFFTAAAILCLLYMLFDILF